jgi:hypothetical protein
LIWLQWLNTAINLTFFTRHINIKREKIDYSEFLKRILKMHIDRTQIDKKVSEFITDAYIEQFFGKEAKKYILLYSDLAKYKSIKQLLPKKKDFRIILIEEKALSGHWICILRNNDVIEVFNSYGTKPSSELNLLSEHQKEELNENVKWLNVLLNKAIKLFHIIYNNKRFQKLDDNVSTCGRHVLLRLLMFLYYDLDLAQYIQFIDFLKRRLKLNADEIVSLLIV